jgi:CheY-like chemotaxis protein/anti-sigma regulatory factor (Ser/Thr protein kinase)
MSTKPLTVLVIDDSSQTWLLVSRFLWKLGYSPVRAQSGEEALSVFGLCNPDFILLDVHMTGIDGYETAQRLRKLAGANWVPIIFLSASTEEDERVKGLESGGDDYLTKPISFRVLAAKMQALQRVADMQHLLRENAEQLERYREDNEREQRLAKHLMDQLVRIDALKTEGVDYWLSPAQHFSGDLLAVAQTPGGVLHVILADGTGHGLSAALSIVPVTDIFYSMTERGFSIASIVRELNRKVKKLLPTGRFVAATLASIDRQNHTIEVWNGGNPEALFVSLDGSCPRSWSSVHPALGILKDEQFSDSTEIFEWVKPGRLYMCSDGLLEAENPTGEAFGPERLRRLLLAVSLESRFDRVRTAVTAHLDGHPAHDDVSLLAVDCPRSKPKQLVVRESEHSVSVSSFMIGQKRWRISVRLSAEELKIIDIVPFLIGWVEQVKVDTEHRGPIFLILSELLNNALDHGLLGLASSLKNDPEDGFEKYLTERGSRLAALTSGFIEIEVTPCWQPDGEMLKIYFKDSGNGFDYQTMLNADITTSTTRAGRGVALLRTVCSQISYLGNGNEVVAYYPLA